MPFSSPHGKQHIKRIVEALPHATLLDVGCGCGTYAEMFPESYKTGLEIWWPYFDQYKLWDKYDQLHQVDARVWRPTSRYDVAIAGDVLEHMTAEEAQALHQRLLKCADTVVVSIPIGYYPQGEYEGNAYEAHVVDHWTDAAVREVFGEPDWSAIDHEIGVYIWSVHPIPEEPSMKICVYAIAKNEAQFVERFCKAAAPADLILIADTGSTDDTVELAKKHGAQTHQILISPWRFDHARNAALALIPADVDVCVSLDLDEELQPGWREEIERVWKPETTRLRYYFDWGVGIKFKYEKIHGRKGYFWHHPCHEYPTPDGRIVESWADTDMLLVIHKPDNTKSRGQYLPLLKLSVEEDPHCPRNAFYYARELSFHNQWQEAIKECDRYLNLPRATWINERCYAYRVKGRCWNELGNTYEAEKAFHLAAAEAPNTREPWCELAMMMYRQERWARCLAYALRTLEIKNRELVYTVDPEVWGSRPHDLASVAAWALGLKPMAIDQAKQAIEKNPDDLRLRRNLELMLQDAA